MGCCGSKKNSDNESFMLACLAEHSGGINCLALSEDGSVIATGSEDKTCRLWTTKTEDSECIGVLVGHEDYINCVVLEENYVLTGSADKTIRKWDMGTCDCVYIFRGHNSLINRIICTGDLIFSSSYDRTARAWDFDTGELIRVFTGHKRGVYPLIFITGDDGGAGGGGGWHNSSVTSGDVLITGSADFTARLWSYDTGKCLRTYAGHTGAVTCMGTDRDGKTLFTGSTDNTVRSWKIQSGEELKVFQGHQGAIICLHVSNKLLYTGSSDHTVRSWVIEFGHSTRTFKGHRHTVSTVRVHQGLLYTTCGDGNCRCYDAKSGAVRRVFKGHTANINAFQIVDNRLFTASHDSTMRVWDLSGISGDTTKPVNNGHSNGEVNKVALEMDKYDGVGGGRGGSHNGGLSGPPSTAGEKNGKLIQVEDFTTNHNNNRVSRDFEPPVTNGFPRRND